MKNLRRVLTMALLVVFLGSLGMIAFYRWQDVESDTIYRQAEQLAITEQVQIVPAQPAPVPEEEPEVKEQLLQALSGDSLAAGSLGQRTLVDRNAAQLLSIDIQALRKVNEDVLGWIMIPGTNISYPLLQGDDNEHYLNYTWNNKKKYVGSIFLEHTNSPEMTDLNTIIYGHNLINQTMLSQLHLYKEQSFWEKYPYVYIVTDQGALRYKIYAAYEVPTDARAFQVHTTGKSSQHQTFLRDGVRRSVLDTGITPEAFERVITFSTCTGVTKENRWVVQAVLEGKLRTPA